MVKLKFVVRDGALVLRISGNRERYYKSVKHLLTGSPNIDRHWSDEKERFASRAVFCTENNRALGDFKAFYKSLIEKRPELSPKQVAQFHSGKNQEFTPKEKDMNANTVDLNLVDNFLTTVIEREKAKPGCNFESYCKAQSKYRKVIEGYSSLAFHDIDFDKCVELAYTFAKHKGYVNSADIFRRLLGKASTDPAIDFSLAQIGDFKFRHYNPHINEVNIKKPEVLSPSQLKAFLNMDTDKATPVYRDRKRVRLYHDFCVFMFHSFFAPCDVAKLKYKDISKQDTLHIKRKKTHKPVEVPLNPVMKKIIDKYRGQTVDSYVFPVMDDEEEKKHEKRDYLLKKFSGQLNRWLKYVGQELGVDYDLHAYVFRHTSITVALDSGIPISYVAIAAGTSIDMIQKHYYNGDNPKNVEKLRQVFMCAAD
jgi:integrase